MFTVPTPNVTLSVPSGPLYEGQSLTLICTATLPPSVDTDVTITVVWTPATESDRVTIFPVTGTRSPFISSLTLSPLVLTDAGQYSCKVTAHSSSPHITPSGPGQSLSQTLTVIGTYKAKSLSFEAFYHYFSFPS